MKKEITVVGAGIAGLTAAINLARKDYKVRVLERRDGIGGPARDMETGEMTYVMADGTPMDIKGVERYTGIDISPIAEPLPHAHVYAFGKKHVIEFPASAPAFLFERGSRENSVDMYLYRIAVKEGVDFEFNHPIKTADDFMKLPRGSIIATGLFKEAYIALDVPFVQVYGHIAFRGFESYGGAPVVLYNSKHTWDYAFFSAINNFGGALLFQRGRKLTREGKLWFENRLSADEGIEFYEWSDLEVGVLPTASMRNPRLFQKDYILTGTLAGFQDPVLLFGVHGALISGAISARAVDDPDWAIAEFKKMNILWRLSWLNRKFIEKTYPYGMKSLLRVALPVYPVISEFVVPYGMWLVPGYGRV